MVAVAAHIVAKDGGYELSVEVTSGSISDGTYHVHLGPAGDDSDPLCYSGVVGQGPRIEVTGNAFKVISPILPVGGPYSFFLEDTESPTTVLIDPSVTVISHGFMSSTLSLRGILPRNWRTGYRTPDQEDFPQ